VLGEQAVSLRHITQSLCYDCVHDLAHGVEQPDRAVGALAGVVALALFSQDHCGRFPEVLRIATEMGALIEDRHQVRKRQSPMLKSSRYYTHYVTMSPPRI
jgi:hypothetical protein